MEYYKLQALFESKYGNWQRVRCYEEGQIGKVVKIKADTDEDNRYTFYYLIEFENESRNWYAESELEGIPEDRAL